MISFVRWEDSIMDVILWKITMVIRQIIFVVIIVIVRLNIRIAYMINISKRVQLWYYFVPGLLNIILCKEWCNKSFCTSVKPKLIKFNLGHTYNILIVQYRRGIFGIGLKWKYLLTSSVCFHFKYKSKIYFYEYKQQ